MSERDGWWSLDDGDEYDEMCRWPVLPDDFVRGPRGRTCNGTALTYETVPLQVLPRFQ